jgi:hypothetical protein
MIDFTSPHQVFTAFAVIAGIQVLVAVYAMRQVWLNKRLDHPDADPKRFYTDWDTAAERAGIVIGAPGWGLDGEARLGFPRPVGPYRTPSVRCESGKRPYCTCDICW